MFYFIFSETRLLLYQKSYFYIQQIHICTWRNVLFALELEFTTSGWALSSFSEFRAGLFNFVAWPQKKSHYTSQTTHIIQCACAGEQRAHLNTCTFIFNTEVHRTNPTFAYHALCYFLFCLSLVVSISSF